MGMAKTELGGANAIWCHLVPPVGIEPTPDAYKATARPSCYGGNWRAVQESNPQSRIEAPWFIQLTERRKNGGTSRDRTDPCLQSRYGPNTGDGSQLSRSRFSGISWRLPPGGTADTATARPTRLDASPRFSLDSATLSSFGRDDGWWLSEPPRSVQSCSPCSYPTRVRAPNCK